MNEIKTTIIEQLQRLQALMHRASFRGFPDGGRTRSPHRGQGRILALLKIKPEISQKELSYLLNMSKQSLAELLAKLEKNGFITRETSKDDKRAMTIRLTEEGMKSAEEVDGGALETNVLACLNEQELAAFSAYLGRVIKSYEELFPDEDFDKRHKMMEAFMAFHNRRHRRDHHCDPHYPHHHFDPRERGDCGDPHERENYYDNGAFEDCGNPLDD
jgi:DNA-binding MarR family transcriptional regulator